MNLSERLAKAAMERRRQPEASAQRVHVASVTSPIAGAPDESQSSSAQLPDRMQDPVDAGRVAAMKMRLPEPTSPDATPESTTALPLWQRPFADVMRDAGLATVTELTFPPRADETDEDRDESELAPTIPMPGMWMPPAVVDLDLTDHHVPPLAASESQGLAGGMLRSEHRMHVGDDMGIVNLDDVTIDAEIVADGPSADALLDRWSEDATADAHDRQERVDSLYRRMVDAQQQPRITFGPIDLRDEITVPRAADEITLPRAAPEKPLGRADGEHTCPQCGAMARIDIHDPMRGRIHLSCDSCFKMWQERVESTVQSDEPFMRD